MKIVFLPPSPLSIGPGLCEVNEKLLAALSPLIMSPTRFRIPIKCADLRPEFLKLSAPLRNKHANWLINDKGHGQIGAGSTSSSS